MQEKKRVVVIDGLNVARDKGFSSLAPGHARALVVTIRHFAAHGFDTAVILPRWAMDGGRQKLASTKMAEAEMLLEPSLFQHIHLAPAGVDDDDFIISLALEMGALILSNDLFRQHVTKKLVTKAWLDEHRLSFMFVGNKLVVPSLRSPELISEPAAASPVRKQTFVKMSSPQGARASIGKTAGSRRTARRGLALVAGRQGSGPSMRDLLSRASTMPRFVSGS